MSVGKKPSRPSAKQVVALIKRLPCKEIIALAKLIGLRATPSLMTERKKSDGTIKKRQLQPYSLQRTL